MFLLLGGFPSIPKKRVASQGGKSFWYVANVGKGSEAHQNSGKLSDAYGHGCGSKPMVTHFRTYFSGDWHVHWGYDLDVDHGHISLRSFP